MQSGVQREWLLQLHAIGPVTAKLCVLATGRRCLVPAFWQAGRFQTRAKMAAQWLCTASRRQHGCDALVVEGHAALVQEALLGHLGRHGPQAELSALGAIAQFEKAGLVAKLAAARKRRERISLVKNRMREFR